MAKPRAMVDVVGAEAGANQLLEQIRFFVRSFRGAEAGERTRAVTVADFHQALGGAIERLLPGRGAEMRPRIGRIDQIVGGLGDAVLAHQRLRQPMWMAHIVEAEAALDAKPVLVRGAVAAADVEQLVVLDVVGELTADAAIGTHAVDLAVGILRAHVRVIDQGGGHQRAGRAGLHAFAASDAGRRTHRIVEVEYDLLAVAAPGHADDVVDLHFAAGADAEIALDAGIEIDRHRRMAAVGCRRRTAGEPADLDVLPIGGLPEFRFRIVRDVLGRLVRQQQLDHHATRRLGTIGLGLDLHARGRRADAAGRQHAFALDLDHADTAIAVGTVAWLWRIAEMRKLDAHAARGAEDGLARA